MQLIQHHGSNLMSDVVASSSLSVAYASVCKARINSHSNDDIWHLRHHWCNLQSQLRKILLAGEYRLSPLQVYNASRGMFSRWCSQDAVILKALSTVLTPIVQRAVGKRCAHLKNHGGIRGAVKKVKSSLSQYRHVIQSDVKSFYQSMRPEVVMSHCKQIIKDKRILNLIHQYLTRCEVKDGDYRLVERGIPKGCPLSPLLGALMLKSLDTCAPEAALYVRYMDDWVIAVRTKSQLRRMVKTMHRVMHRLKFELALDKTFIGKICKGFDFLGYRFNHTGIIAIARRSIQKFNERKAALYEQGASDQRIEAYVRRWELSFGLITHRC